MPIINYNLPSSHIYLVTDITEVSAELLKDMLKSRFQTQVVPSSFKVQIFFRTDALFFQGGFHNNAI
jgi:hypothetical protein